MRLLLSSALLVVSVAALSQPAPPPSTDRPAIIVGGGRIGGLLMELGCEGDVLVCRGEPIPPSPSSGPIYVCTRNDALADIVARTPPARRADLCFLQNGVLDNFLSQQGLADNTQALLYLAVPTRGAPPVDGLTARNPEGLTCATGAWAGAFASRLAKGGLKCEVKDGDAYRRAMLEKHVFICCTNVIGQARRAGCLKKNAGRSVMMSRR